MLTGSLNQFAVLWTKNVTDGYGQISYNAAISLCVRWEESAKQFISLIGKQEISSHVVYAETSLEYDDYMWLGSLSSLSNAQKADPRLVVGSLPVRGRNKSPDLQGGLFVSKAFL